MKVFPQRGQRSASARRQSGGKKHGCLWLQWGLVPSYFSFVENSLPQGWAFIHFISVDFVTVIICKSLQTQNIKHFKWKIRLHLSLKIILMKYWLTPGSLFIRYTQDLWYTNNRWKQWQYYCCGLLFRNTVAIIVVPFYFVHVCIYCFVFIEPHTNYLFSG